MRSASPLITKQRLDALTASARFWLYWVIAIVSRIGALNGSHRLRAYVDRAERWIERILFLYACAQLPPPPEMRRHPRGAPAGFRTKRARHRQLYRMLRIRLRDATLAKRLANIAAAFAAPDRAIARLIKRLRRRLTGSRLVVTTPAADCFDTIAQAAVAHVDSS